MFIFRGGVCGLCDCECRESLFSTLLFLLVHVEIVTRTGSFL